MAKIPFDVKFRPQIESGEYKVELRDGRPAKIIYWDAKGPSPIVCLYMTDDGSETTVEVRPNGRWSDDPSCEMYDDLFIVTPEEELTAWEKAVGRAIAGFQFVPRDKDGMKNIHDVDAYIKKNAAELLAIARKQLQPEIEAEMKEALKDLPRWSINSDPDFKPGKYFCVANALISPQGWSIPFKDLEKLPGFKED